VTDLAPLLLLYLLSQGKRRGARPRPSHDDPHAFAPDGLRPAAYYGAGPATGWIPYAPLTPEVIARAEAILHDPSKHETIEPDPTHPGAVVRYLRTPDTHTGKVNVTAWRARNDAVVRT